MHSITFASSAIRISLESLETSTSNSNPFYVVTFPRTIRDAVGIYIVSRQTA